MAEENVLSQEEIDALMDNAPGEKNTEEEKDKTVENDSMANKNESDVASAMDFANQERIVRGQFPVLERIYDRMLRAFSDDVFTLMSRDISIIQEPFSILKANEFLATLEPPMVINIYRVHPLRGKSMLMFENKLIFELVENYFGGHSQYEGGIFDRDITNTELRIVEIFTNKLIKKLHKAWAPIMEVELNLVNSEPNPQMINIYSPSDLLIISRFVCSFEKDAGSFYIVLPYTMVDPIREQLELGASQTEEEFDPNWTNSIKDELMMVPLEVSAIIAKATLSLRNVNEWKIGDFIPVEMMKVVPLDIEGIPTFTTKVGTHNDKCALQIIKRIRY